MRTKITRKRKAPAIQDKSQQGTSLYYGLPLTAKRLSEVYGICRASMGVILCRADFAKFEKDGCNTPRYYTWCKEFETKLDNFMNKKGYYRCIGSKVPSRYSLVKEKLS